MSCSSTPPAWRRWTNIWNPLLIHALVAGGEPGRIKRIACRFSRYAYPGDDIAVSVYGTGPAASGLHAYAFEVASMGNTVLKNGWVEVTPAA